MELDIGRSTEMLFQKVVDWADTGWLPRSELLLYSLQGGSLTQREQGWHERVALFSAFGLSDGVCFAGCITPHVLGGFGVEKPDEWQVFFPRVRTPCGRSAQVIVEEKET